MIELEVLCRVCRRSFIPTRADVVAGVWRICPRCRDGPETPGVRSRVAPDQELSDDPRASDVEADPEDERTEAA